jgi:UDP-N-acetylmuramate--alanine ligase
LETAKLSPSFLIGAADAGNLKTNSKKGQGEYFVLEADEYRKSPEDPSPKFLDLTPQIAVITSIELDHPDIYPSIEDIYNAFFRFACRVPRDGTIILCWDYPRAKKLLRSLADRNFETYGFESDAKWRIVNEQASDRFYLEKNRDKYGPFELQIPGKHNILNATAAVITSLKLGVSEDVIKKSLKQFKGVGRRFEKVFESEKIKIYDDYAHHPTAIQATLAAFRQKFPKYKIWCIFQPHTFSRTQRLLKEFGLSFSKADRVYIADIYSSEREKDGKINSLDLVEEIKKNRSGVRIIRDLPKASELIKEVKTPTVIVTMGAGDIFKLGQEMAKKIKAAK